MLGYPLIARFWPPKSLAALQPALALNLREGQYAVIGAVCNSTIAVRPDL